MQFIAFRNSSTGQILYVQTKDPDGQVIDWEVVNSGSYSLKLRVYTLAGVFPSNFYITDDTMTAATDTEFYRKVALKYKAWAINQKWAKRKNSKFDSMVTMAVSPDLLSTRMTDNIGPFINSWNGEDKACWITYWRTWWQLDLEGGAPDYRTNRNMYSEFSNSLTSLNNQKCSSFPYTNALLWDSRNKFTEGVRIASATNGITATGIGNDGKKYYTETDKLPAYNEIVTSNPAAIYDATAQAATLKNKNPTTGQIEIAADPNNSAMKYMCPATQKWQNTFNSVSSNLVSDQWKGVYFDQAAFMAPKLCYDDNHGHNIADPLAWQNGLRQIMTNLRTDGLMIFTEGNAEIYMDLIDAFLSYNDTGLGVASGTQVPLFKEVYGDIARFISWQSLPVSDPDKTISDLTPQIMAKVVRQSANFGSMFYGAPYFIGWGASYDIQEKLRTDSSYADTFDLINNPQYKKVYERGGGAINWTKLGSGSSPAAVNVVDTETGAAAVGFAIPIAGNGESYELPINQTNLFQASWDMKMTGNYYIDFVVTGSDNNTYYMVYNQSGRNFRSTVSNYLKVGLGADTTAPTGGQWRTIRRDLAADFYEAVPNPKPTLAKVNSILVFGTGLIDNLTLSNSPTLKSDGTSVANLTTTGGVGKAAVYDTDKLSDVIQFSGMIGRDSNQYHTLSINDNQRFDLSWELKTDQYYYVLVQVKADDGTYWNLLYDHNVRDFRLTDGVTVKIGLGGDTKDGNWRTFRRNLADDLFEGTGKNIEKVVEMRFYTNGYIDNVLLWGNGIRTSGR